MSDDITLKLPLDKADVRSSTPAISSCSTAISCSPPACRRMSASASTCAPASRCRSISPAARCFTSAATAARRDGKFDVLYMNPTTSTRFNAVMPEFIRHYGLRMVGGKGGLDHACAEAMREVGCVYLSFLGGGCRAALRRDQGSVEVAWDDLVSHYRLVKLRVESLGPLVVGNRQPWQQLVRAVAGQGA